MSSGPADPGGPSQPKPDPNEPVGGPDPLLRGGSFIHPANDGQTTGGPSPQKKTSSAPRAQRPGSREGLDWLPPGWRVEDRVRTSGATAGSVDKYYFDPATGRRFRSKKEVLSYLETGSVQKRKTVGETSNSGVNASDNSGKHPKKKSNKEAKRAIPMFDYSNVPDSIEWALTDANEDLWTPFLGGKKVDELERVSWNQAFASVIDKKLH